MFNKKNLLFAFIIGLAIFFVSYNNLNDVKTDEHNIDYKDDVIKATDKIGDFYKHVEYKKHFEEIVGLFKYEEVFYINTGVKELNEFINEDSEYYKKRYEKLVELRKKYKEARLAETYIEDIVDNNIEFEVKVKFTLIYTNKKNEEEIVNEHVSYKLELKNGKYIFIDEVDLSSKGNEQK